MYRDCDRLGGAYPGGRDFSIGFLSVPLAFSNYYPTPFSPGLLALSLYLPDYRSSRRPPSVVECNATNETYGVITD